ncbi:MAG TPA: LrgB family protein [Longimicrobiaceae bacterium]|nr:LrgB family protein [Longimicrobiaceae bacterium]
MGEIAGGALAVAATIAVFAAAQRLYRRSRILLLNPVLVAIVVLIVALRALGVDYEAYDRGGRVLSYFLGPAVVALGVPLAAQWEEIRRRARSILVSIAAGSVTGVLAAAGTAALLGASPSIVRTMAPRSVTTPIAMGVAAKVGGIPSLTAVIVVATGVLGAVIGPTLLRAIGVRSRTALGLALGSASHGIGTARALEEGEVEGATAGLAIGLMGVATAILAPILLRLLF